MLKRIKEWVRCAHIAYLRFRVSICPKIKVDGPSLFLAPHPDDEAIGCGGLISHLCACGNPPHVAILTGGGKSMGEGQSGNCGPKKMVIEKRRELTLKSAKKLGLPENHIHFLDFRDGHISERPEAEMQRLSNLIDDINPSAIFVPHWGEGWPDHVVTREILLSQLGGNSEKKNPQIFEFCVWMWYYNVWNLNWKNAFKFRMTNAEHQAKLQAIDAYIKPLAPNGKPWSGVLPKAFIKANKGRMELYFRVRDGG